MSLSQCLDENTALELLDAKLASALRSKVERHLEGCDACRELVAELAKVSFEAEKEDAISADTERTPFAQSAALAARSQVGPYRIEHAIGSGASGTVYRAIDERVSPPQIVALKMVTDQALRARFSREAATLSRLNHPAIVRYIGHGDSSGGMYLAMEWLEGEDLEQRLRRGPLGWQGARTLGLRLSAALSHAHGLGCVHRDLSPRNVFLPKNLVEEAKLLDFGLVRTEGGVLHASKNLERTSSQALLGTPFYMSPEQVRDPKSVDARADLFGLGVLLYESVAGVRPFQGEDLFSVWVQIVDHPTPDLRVAARGQVPEAMVQLIESLLAKEPAGRPASASDVHRSLSAMASHGSGTLAMPAVPAVSPSAPPVTVQQALLRAQQTYRQGSHPSHPSHHPHPSVPTAPPPPHLAAQSLPAPPMPVPRGRSGVYIAAGVGVTAALVTVTTVGVYAAKQGAFASATSSGQTDSSKKKAAGVSTDVNGQPLLVGDDDKDKDEDDKDKDKDDTTPPSPIITKKDASSSSGKKAARYMCGSDTVETKRGGRYEPDPNMPDISEAVWVGGDCKATLEDCTIGGKNSVLVLGSGTLTLRRCRVQGAVKLVGDEAKLHLEGTTLPQAPEIVGKGKVIRH